MKTKRSVKWLHGCLAALFVLFAAAGTAGAFELGVRAYAWFPDLKTSEIQTIQNAAEGTKIDAKDVLGVGNKALFIGEIYGGLGKHHGSFTYTPVGYSDDKIIPTDITFNGVTFTRNSSVKTEIGYAMLDFKYQYDIVNMENILAGFSFGPMAQVKFSTGETKLNAAGGTEQKKSFSSILPMVGVGAHVGLIANLLEARAQVTGGGYGGGNYAVEALADISVTPFPFVDINAGYKAVKLKMDVNDYVMDQFLTGPYVALTVGF
ncbi:MAG TPA: hypothetical protein P5269_06790 [Syntrophales bacterium]|nr:hypothetical protein [Syntrophales bacterium]HRS87324.1 hypothetical protein [Syntrophales bacterium]